MSFPFPSQLLDELPRMFVAGRWVSSGDRRDVISPSTGAVVTSVPRADAEHISESLSRAKDAQRPWARRSYQDRALVLEKVVSLVVEHAEELARIVVLEQGKTITEARGEIQGVRAFFDYAISQKYRDVGELVAPTADGRQLSIREVPVGVVVAIIPWNFPAAIFARKVAPALMAGNAIIVKPSEETPLASLAMARICEMAGVPKGLLSVLPGPGRQVGDALIRHPEVNMVTVTGSTRAGREILSATAQQVIPVSLELGGKAPVIVFDDADLDLAVRESFEARFMNCGQVCTCNERTFVQRGVYDEFIRRTLIMVDALKVGDPFDDASQMGPKVSRPEWDKVKDLVDRAIREGATLAAGGGTPKGFEGDSGYWFAPTVLTDVTSDMEIAQKEVFGPVYPIIPFDSYDEVIGWANSTEYGLTSTVYTSNLCTAMNATDDLEFGEVYVNQTGPEQVQGFHTGWKLSGLGGDDGKHGFERYLKRKTVYLQYRPARSTTEESPKRDDSRNH